MLKESIIKFAKEQGLIIGFADYKDYEQLNNSRFETDRLYFAKSIISVAFPITKSDEHNMASFALETDYHKTLKLKLENIKEFILKQVDANIEYFCDNGPMDDKLCAYLAGIGHYGKNSLIITKEYGSYVMLGELVTDIEFKKDKIDTVGCGTCTLCKTNCPTDAIGYIYKKCLSGYLQRKNTYKDDVYEKFNKIYGCDICQSVCPKNRKVEEKSTYIYDNIDIRRILKSNKRDFRKYKDTAFYWLGHNVMKRNAIVFAKNNGIDITEELKYVNSKEDYMLKAIEYYKK